MTPTIHQSEAQQVMKHSLSILLCGVSALAASAAHAQSGPVSGDQASVLDEIVVTASKRADTANNVPMSITAATGEALVNLGVNSPNDLAKAVPGFTYTPSTYSTPRRL